MSSPRPYWDKFGDGQFTVWIYEPRAVMHRPHGRVAPSWPPSEVLVSGVTKASWFGRRARERPAAAGAALGFGEGALFRPESRADHPGIAVQFRRLLIIQGRFIVFIAATARVRAVACFHRGVLRDFAVRELRDPRFRHRRPYAVRPRLSAGGPIQAWIYSCPFAGSPSKCCVTPGVRRAACSSLPGALARLRPRRRGKREARRWRRTWASSISCGRIAAGRRRPEICGTGSASRSASSSSSSMPTSRRAPTSAEMLPYFAADPSLGIVQSPQYFQTEGRKSWIERGAGAVQELFYRLVQVSRDRHEVRSASGHAPSTGEGHWSPTVARR